MNKKEQDQNQDNEENQSLLPYQSYEISTQTQNNQEYQSFLRGQSYEISLHNQESNVNQLDQSSEFNQVNQENQENQMIQEEEQHSMQMGQSRRYQNNQDGNNQNINPNQEYQDNQLINSQSQTKIQSKSNQLILENNRNQLSNSNKIDQFRRGIHNTNPNLSNGSIKAGKKTEPKDSFSKVHIHSRNEKYTRDYEVSVTNKTHSLKRHIPQVLSFENIASKRIIIRPNLDDEKERLSGFVEIPRSEYDKYADKETIFLERGMNTGCYRFRGREILLKDEDSPEESIQLTKDEIIGEINKRAKNKKEKKKKYEITDKYYVLADVEINNMEKDKVKQYKKQIERLYGKSKTRSNLEESKIQITTESQLNSKQLPLDTKKTNLNSQQSEIQSQPEITQSNIQSENIQSQKESKNIQSQLQSDNIQLELESKDKKSQMESEINQQLQSEKVKLQLRSNGGKSQIESENKQTQLQSESNQPQIESEYKQSELQSEIKQFQLQSEEKQSQLQSENIQSQLKSENKQSQLEAQNTQSQLESNNTQTQNKPSQLETQPNGQLNTQVELEKKEDQDSNINQSINEVENLDVSNRDSIAPTDNYSRYLLEQINKVRMDPQSFIGVIEDSKANIKKHRYGGFIYKDKISIALFRGEPAFDDAIDYLNNTEPMGKLEYSPELTAQLPQNDIEIKDKNDLKKKVEKMIEKKYSIKSYWRDIIKDPEISFLLMMVDDNVASSGMRRRDILNPKVKYIGISSVEIKGHFVCYITLSYGLKKNDK